METIINQMLNKYEIQNTEDRINALKEVIQECVLCGLARGGCSRCVEKSPDLQIFEEIR